MKKVELNWMDERVVNYLKSRNPQKKQEIIGTVFDSIDNMNEKQELIESLLPEGTHIHGNPKRKPITVDLDAVRKVLNEEGGN